MNRATNRPSRGLRLVKTGSAVGLITLVLFTVLEMGLRIFWPQNIRVSYAVEESLAMEDSVLGHRMRPQATATLRGPEFTALYRINSQGFRDRSEYQPQKAEGTVRILILGDSFAFGAGSRYEAIWPVLFEQKLRQAGYEVEVIKAGALGFDTRTEARYLEELLPVYRPDFVILTLLPNDLFTNTPASAELPPPPDAGEKGMSLHLGRFAARMAMASDYLYCKLYMATPRKEFFLEEEGDAFREKVAITREHLQRAQKLCRDAGATFSVLSIPQQFQVLAAVQKTGGINVNCVDEALGSFAGEAGFPWVSTLPELTREYRAIGRDLFYRYDGHLTPEGNRVIAEYLFVVSTEHYPGVLSMEPRTYRDGDGDAVIALWQACDLVVPWNDPRKDIARKLREDPQGFLVGVVDGSIVASLMFGYDGHRGWVNYLAVHPVHRGRGYGRALMDWAEVHLRERGCPKINLQVRHSNTRAIAFYEGIGYTEDAVTSMGKRLEPDLPRED